MSFDEQEHAGHLAGAVSYKKVSDAKIGELIVHRNWGSSYLGIVAGEMNGQERGSGRPIIFIADTNSEKQWASTSFFAGDQSVVSLGNEWVLVPDFSWDTVKGETDSSDFSPIMVAQEGTLLVANDQSDVNYFNLNSGTIGHLAPREFLKIFSYKIYLSQASYERGDDPVFAHKDNRSTAE